MGNLLSQDEIFEMMQKSGLSKGGGIIRISQFANLVVAAEREACAKLCEDLTEWHSKTVIAALDSAAENIRARSLNVHK